MTHSHHHNHNSHDDHSGHDKHEGHSVGMFRDRFWITLLLTVPTVISRIIADAQVSLRDCAFAHMFGKEGFVDALPQLPEGVERGGAGAALFQALGQLEAATLRLLDAA